MDRKKELGTIIKKRLDTYKGLPNIKPIQDSIVGEVYQIIKHMGIEGALDGIDFDKIFESLELGDSSDGRSERDTK